MLDFTPVRQRTQTLSQLCENLTLRDLHRLTGEMVDAMLETIAGADDDAVTFQPVDPAASDPYAADKAEADLPWTLGHVVAHTTASAEESAFLAAELARGVPNHGRSRAETPWRTMTTVQGCRDRLEESRRMRLASLQLWPDRPCMDLSYEPWPGAGPFNAVTRFVAGLWHDSDHLGQLREIARQASATST